MFTRVGFFNSNMMSGGDKEWGNRVHAAGLELVYAEDAIVYHPARYHYSELVKKVRRVAGGVSQMARSNSYTAVFINLVKELTPPVRRTIKVIKSPKCKDGLVKITTCAIIISLKVISIYEKIKLIFGVAPTRS